MKSFKNLGLASLLAIACLTAASTESSAAYRYNYRQYYSSWRHYPQRAYYYRTYYYKPAPKYTSYRYHYCVYYPSQPRYVYYYNPYKRVYWGRFDTQGDPGQQYSLLAEKDRKGTLQEIPDSAFPAPGRMPTIPEATDDTAVEVPRDLPDVKKEPPQDLPNRN